MIPDKCIVILKSVIKITTCDFDSNMQHIIINNSTTYWLGLERCSHWNYRLCIACQKTPVNKTLLLLFCHALNSLLVASVVLII